MHWYIHGLKKYVVFSGRARRKEFWLFTLFNFIALYIFAGLLMTLSSIINPNGQNEILFLTVLALLFIGYISTIISEIAIAVRRLHDINRSGWWLFLDLILYVGMIILIVWWTQDSQEGENRYGLNPKSNGQYRN